MALMLDRRQRAMLAEMGVRVWLPLPEAEASASASAPMPADAVARVAVPEAAPSLPVQPPAAPVAVPPAVSATAPEAARPRSPLPVATTAPAAFSDTDTDSGLQPLPLLQGQSLPQLQQLADSCQGCALHQGRQHSVWDRTPIPAAGPRWLFVLDAPGAAENAAGQPAQGDAGKLLQQMLAALRLPAAQVRRVHATRCAPEDRVVTPAEVGHCSAWLRREIAHYQPHLIVALGRAAACALLHRDQPLRQLRGQLARLHLPPEDSDLSATLADIPVVVSYPLDYLLRHPEAKPRAWSDLCLAADLVQQRSLPPVSSPDSGIPS